MIWLSVQIFASKRSNIFNLNKLITSKILSKKIIILWYIWTFILSIDAYIDWFMIYPHLTLDSRRRGNKWTLWDIEVIKADLNWLNYLEIVFYEYQKINKPKFCLDYDSFNFLWIMLFWYFDPNPIWKVVIRATKYDFIYIVFCLFFSSPERKVLDLYARVR